MYAIFYYKIQFWRSYKSRESGAPSALFESSEIKYTVRMSLIQSSSSWDRDANKACPPILANTGLFVRMKLKHKIEIGNTKDKNV